MELNRRDILRLTGAGAAAAAIPRVLQGREPAAQTPDHRITIARGLVELAPDQIVSTTLYNNQFPGPLIRMQEGRPFTVEITNQTTEEEFLHWHGQTIPVDVDGAGEEGSRHIAPGSTLRETFIPGPRGFRFYHTHVIAGANLDRGQYSGLAGPVYIEPKNNAGAYDREIFLTLKEFGPTFSRGGDMAQDALPGAEISALKTPGEAAMNASLQRGQPHGYEVGYQFFSINGRALGHGEPIRVRQGERVLFHILNASAGEIRSLALPGHQFQIIDLDGNPVPTQAKVPLLWIGTAERISAIVEMNHPGIWIMGDLSDDDRNHGMGIVIEYAGSTGTPQWRTPAPFEWDYTLFGAKNPVPTTPDHTIDLVFAKDNAADAGFNRWTINGTPYAMNNKPLARLIHGRRYRLRLQNQSDDIHPIHLHRHSFELTRIFGKPTAGVMKDVVMLGGYQEAEIDFIADNPGRTLFHCHQQLHMDFGFMGVFDYA